MKPQHILGIVIIAVSVGIIVGTYADSSTYSDFNKAREMHEVTHVIGQIDKTHQMVYNPFKDANAFTFYLKDQKGENCKIVFDGSKPQDFERAEQIVLTGKMVQNEFHASQILMKCPSKYTNDKLEIANSRGTKI